MGAANDARLVTGVDADRDHLKYDANAQELAIEAYALGGPGLSTAQTTLAALSLLHAAGVVIGGGDLDGHETPLATALSDLIGFGDGAFVSCVPGKLGYYQYAGMNGGHLCQR